MSKCIAINHSHGNVSCVLLHHVTQHAESAAKVMATQWNHSDGEVRRNIKSMIDDSKDSLPCHLALIYDIDRKSPGGVVGSNQDSLLNTSEVVGHVKLVRASGRSDGSCCISYSLVVPESYRGMGLGRMLMVEAENYARTLSMSYMYLSTSDKVEFYEHLGYKQCEPVSSLGDNSKRLNSMQISALENIFSKRLNVDDVKCGNTWLRKRLIVENEVKSALDLTEYCNVLATSLDETVDEDLHFRDIGFVNRMNWQQQTGPSCGISALNMLHTFLAERGDRLSSKILNTRCSCIGECNNSADVSNLTIIFDIAKKLCITNDGELFCAYNLAYLGDVGCNLKLKVMELEGGTIIKVVESVLKGFPVLIPYDKSPSFRPTKAEGRYSHWGVIIGLILPKRCADEISSELKSCRKPLSGDRELELYDISSGVNIDLNYSLEQLLEYKIICMHGMSEKPFVCSFRDMVVSNSQLKSSKSKFYLSSEDLLHLRNKIVFVDY